MTDLLKPYALRPSAFSADQLRELHAILRDEIELAVLVGEGDPATNLSRLWNIRSEAAKPLDPDMTRGQHRLLAAERARREADLRREQTAEMLRLQAERRRLADLKREAGQ